MKSISLSIFSILVISILSCKYDTPNQAQANQTFEHKDVPNLYVMMNQEEISPDEVSVMRQKALAVLNHRQSENSNKSYTIIDKDVWRYDGFVKNSDFLKSDDLAGKWIDFKEDLTYEYGSFQVKEGSGRYFFDLESKKLLLLDDHPFVKPQEFDVKLNNDMMVLVGEYLYNDNNLQGKLVRISEKPAKQ